MTGDSDPAAPWPARRVDSAGDGTADLDYADELEAGGFGSPCHHDGAHEVLPYDRAPVTLGLVTHP